MPNRNLRLAAVIGVLAVGMVGVSYAAVPLYYAFCRATGFNGTTQVAGAASALKGERTLKIRFDANVAPGLDWTFEPEVDQISLRTGVTATVFFKVHNRSDRPTASTAVYNVSPEVSGAWFDKISCFCFSEQHLGPHETAELPVVFYLDPRLEKDASMKDVENVTLSYTLFAAKSEPKPLALRPTGASNL